MKSFWLFLLTSLALLSAAGRASAQGIPSDAEWFAFETPHFDVSFTAGLEPLARRAADRAERAYTLLADRFVDPPEGRIQLLVSDNADLSNGFGAPFPRNRIVAYAHPPASALSLAYTDDWIGLLVLHELVHIFHLDYANGVWPALREVFGRDPYLFPQIFTPGWMVEGLGVYFESEYSAGGRVAGSIFDMSLRAAILEDDFFDIDTATLDPVVWPGSTTRYIYGSFFIDYLARTYGPDRVAALIEEIGGRIIPFRFDDAARDALGTTLSQAWKDWEDELRVSYSAQADSLRALGLTKPEILSTGGWAAHHPRFSPDGSRIAYAANDGRDDAAIVVSESDGRTVHVVDRSSTEAPAWTRDGDLVQSQLDFEGRNRLFSDVYVVSLDGDVRRLTHGARLSEPDPHPSGDRAVVVADAGGTNVLASLDLRTGEVTNLTTPDLDVYWSSPRWSPQGDRIVASRWSAGGRYDVVVLDSAGAVVREITADRAIDSNPAWSPDGRYIVFSSDRTGIPNLFAYDLEQGRLWQVTNVLTGAFEPDVSPDGRSIVFAIYHADGYSIARIPFSPERWRPAPPVSGRGSQAPGSASDLARETGGAVHRYSPWPTVLPTHWSVLTAWNDVGTGAGVALSGEDAIERHLWALEALAYPSDRLFEASAAYDYRGFGDAILSFGTGQHWWVQSLGPRGEEAGSSPDLLRRERTAEAVLSWVHPGWRLTYSFETAVDLRDIDFVWRDPGFLGLIAPSVPADAGASVGFGFSTVRGFALSLGPQEGLRASARIQARRFLSAPVVDPKDRDYFRATSDVRAYHGLEWFGFAPHVLAVRADAGIEGHTGGGGFSLGGTGSASAPSISSSISGRSTFPLRGYPAGAQRGSRFLTASAEYRFPFALIEDGYRLAPLAVDRLWADLFVDAGTAWCPTGRCTAAIGAPDSPDPLVSIGAELMLDLRLGYTANLPLRAGVGLPLETAASPEFYFTIGRSW